MKEYSCLDYLVSPNLIVDCGANAGFSSAYLLSQFPSASVIAIEPDSDNFDMLCKNTSEFGSRCMQLHAGIWSKDCGLRFSEEVFGDGREWSISVRQAEDGESEDIKGLSMHTILKMLPMNQNIDLLKIDIEGSEKDLFKVDCQDWLKHVDNIIIELHSEECKKLYLEQVALAGFNSRMIGGLMLSTRI